MRLLQYTEKGFFLTEDLTDNIPPYAILSHTWGPGEVTYEDLATGTGHKKPGMQKIWFCVKEAHRRGLQYFWIDTCCIDRKDITELSEAIVSMYRWYRDAAVCLVYLSDVVKEHKSQPSEKWFRSFCQSRWFTRGWTLPELLAPEIVEFFDVDGTLIGNKSSLEGYISKATDIPSEALRGCDLSKFSIAERMKWMENRATTIPEDKVYALFGIFDVYFPAIYGIGGKEAMSKLEKEIERDVVPFIQTPISENYSPLQDNQFRIVILYPELDGVDIKLDIREFNFEHHPNYTALSYVWGDEKANTVIQMNGNQVMIRSNLFNALQRLRGCSSVQYLWIDAICIDQSNMEERSIQVSRMADIYRGAENVAIWLGEGDSTSDMAMELIPQLSSPHFKWSGAWWDNFNFLAFNHLLERQWFRRRWVIQEAALAQKSAVICGEQKVDMETLLFAVRAIKKQLQKTPAASNAVENMSGFLDSPATRLLDLIRVVSDPENSEITLETLVDLSTFANATDQRDVIFALLGLSSDTGPDSLAPVQPDYSKSRLDVFADFVSHCCQTSGSLDIICRPWAPDLNLKSQAAFLNSRTVQKEEMPSWIASREGLPFGDLSFGTNARLNGKPLVGDNLNRVYNAHFDTIPSVYFGQDENGQFNGSLFAKGIILGSVDNESQRLANAVISERSLAVLDPNYLRRSRHSQLSDTVWRVLCADRNGKDRTPAPPMFGIAMKQLTHLQTIDVEELLETKLADHHMEEFLESVRDVTWNRRTFQGHTKYGHQNMVGLIPQRAQIGDQVVILFGCSVPVVLRKSERDDGASCWKLIGEAYVHGFMDGEGISSLSAMKLKLAEKEFEIR